MMSILSQETITKEMRKGNIFIDPWNPRQHNPSSYDVCLGFWFAWLKEFRDNEPLFGPIWSMERGEGIIIPTTGVLLATTAERIGAKGDITTELRGKSSTARIGVEATRFSGYGDPGYFDQYWTLSLSSVVPGAVLYVGEPVAQIVFHRMTTAPVNQYDGQYNINDWPYAMLPASYRRHYKFIQYPDEGSRVIITDGSTDESWKDLLV